MFQKLGLLDVFSGLWNRRKHFLLIAAVCALAAAVMTVISCASVKPEEETIVPTYYKSITLSIRAEGDWQQSDAHHHSQNMRNEYHAALSSEIFAQYLQDNLGGDTPLYYSIVVNESAVPSFFVPNHNIMSIAKAIGFECPEDTSTIRVFLSSYDSALGDRILDLVLAYASGELKTKLGAAEVVELGRVSYENHIVTRPGTARPTARMMVTEFISKFVLLAVLLAAVYAIGIFVYMMLCPVINRQSDLQPYSDAPVWELGEKPSGTDSQALYAAKQLIKHCAKGSTAVVSCPGEQEAAMKNSAFSRIADALGQLNAKLLTVNLDPAFADKAAINGDAVRLASLLEDIDRSKYDIILVNLPPVAGNEHLLADDGTDRMILGVKYGKTSYKLLEKVLASVKENDIEPISFFAGSCR